jgi:hypothetical protein
MISNKMGFGFYSSNYNSDITDWAQQWIIVLAIIFVLLFIWKKRNSPLNETTSISNNFVDQFFIFIILLFFIMIVTRNFTYAITCTIIIYIIYWCTRSISENFRNKKIHKNEIEGFKNESSEEDDETSHEKKDKTITAEDLNKALGNIDSNIEKYKNDKDVQKAAEGIKELIKKLNGGIAIQKSDLQETKPLGVDTSNYKDESKNTALQQAQKETYQLIDSVSALKDTITTLTPVLTQGKEIMNMFQSLKF